MAGLIRSVTLCELLFRNEDGVTFSRSVDDTNATFLTLDEREWHDMGRPSEITVTIVPGSHVGDA